MTLPDMNARAVVIRQSRRVLLILLAADAVVLALPLMALGSPTLTGDSVGGAWFAIVLFGGLGALFVAALVRPASLILGPDGVTHRMLFRQSHRPWSDFAGFHEQRTGRRRNATMVGYTLNRAPLSPSDTSAPTVPPPGGDGSYGNGWSLPVAAVADVLNQGLARWR